MYGQPGVKLEDVDLPAGRVAPGRPEHAQLWQPQPRNKANGNLDHVVIEYVAFLNGHSFYGEIV